MMALRVIDPFRKAMDTARIMKACPLLKSQSPRAISGRNGQKTLLSRLKRAPMANERLYEPRRARHPKSKKVLKKVALWERKFQEAKTPRGRHWAMTQIWRWTTDDHPIIQMWLNRDPRFNDMTWTPLLEES